MFRIALKRIKRKAETELACLRLAGIKKTAGANRVRKKPFDQIYVDPNKISLRFAEGALRKRELDPPNHVVLRRGRPHPIWSTGLIVGGNWFGRAVPYEPRDSLLFEALLARWSDVVPLENSRFFAWASAEVSGGRAVWNGCRSIVDLGNAIARVEALICSVQDRGFKPSPDPVDVCLGPRGELIKVGNGQHRIMLGMISNQRIPVRVVLTHTDAVKNAKPSANVARES